MTGILKNIDSTKTSKIRITLNEGWKSAGAPPFSPPNSPGGPLGPPLYPSLSPNLGLSPSNLDGPLQIKHHQSIQIRSIQFKPNYSSISN